MLFQKLATGTVIAIFINRIWDYLLQKADFK